MNNNIMNFIEKNDVISFVGGGGKTTIMFAIAKMAVDKGFKVLVTTTTKIFMPEKYMYEKIVLNEKSTEVNKGSYTDITVFGQKERDGKIIGASVDDLNRYIKSKDYDLILIEADGSRRKSLKAYKEHEPVVADYSKKICAVISLDIIGKSLDERYVYNSKRLSEILFKKEDDIIVREDIVRLVESDSGLFEKLKDKEKMLILTKCVNKERKDQFLYIKNELESIDSEIKIYQNY